MLVNTDQTLLKLKLFAKEDLDQLYNLIQANQEHLTQNGDYVDMVALSRLELDAQIAIENEKQELYLLVLENEYIGTISLIKYEKTIYGLGYWIGKGFSRKGYMTSAVRAVIDLAQNSYGASEIWAGIKSYNLPSINLVKNLGFTLAREQSTHLSYKLEISSHGAKKFR